MVRLRIKISRRGLAVGIIFGIGLTASGIVIIEYTEAFYLVVILWIALPVMIVQVARWIRNRLLGPAE